MKELISEEKIKQKVSDLSKQINQVFEKETSEVIVLFVLNGSLFFSADLIRLFKFPLLIDSLAIASYETGKSSGEVKWIKKNKISLKDKKVLVLEDIIDTGHSYEFLKKEIQKQGVKKLYFTSLIQRNLSLEIDFVGFKIKSKEFLVGYGLDYKQKHRHLKSIYEIKV